MNKAKRKIRNVVISILTLSTSLPLGGLGWAFASSAGLGWALTSCDNIVDYNDNYTPAERIANTGAPVIRAVYDVADTAFASPITQGTLGQTVVLVGENLNQAQAVSFNTVACDMTNVYTLGTRAIVQIPSKLSMEQVHQIEYTTPQGTTTFGFVIPFPDLTIARLSNEFMWAGGDVTVFGQNFDLYDFEGGASTVAVGDTPIQPTDISATQMTLHIPEGTPDNSQIVFTWRGTDGQTEQRSLPFRHTQSLLYGDFSGVQTSIDGSVQVATDVTDGYGNLHFTGSYPAWSWNTIDLSCNMIDQTVPDVSPSGLTLDDYVLKMEVLTQSSFPLTEQTGLQFCFNWGDSYAWNPADGQGINTLGQWLTVTLPLAPMATNGISAPGTWQTLRISFQPHADYEADFRLANFRIERE